MRTDAAMWAMLAPGLMLITGLGSSLGPPGAVEADVVAVPRLCSPVDVPALIDACGDNMEGTLGFSGGADATFGSGSFATFGPGSGAAFTGGADAGFAGAGSDATFTGGAEAVFGSGGAATFQGGSAATFATGAAATFNGGDAQFVGSASTATFSGGADASFTGAGSNVVFDGAGTNGIDFPGADIVGAFKGTVDIPSTGSDGGMGCGFVSPAVPGLSANQPIVATPSAALADDFVFHGAVVTLSPLTQTQNVMVCWKNLDCCLNIDPQPIAVWGLVLK